MASWMIHLRVADALLDRFPELSAIEFIFGNIAPDSGVPNGDNTSFTPPKSVSHFQKIQEDGHRVSGYDVFADKFLTHEKLAEYDHECLSFHLGYFSHLLTDYLWANHIVIPAFSRENEEFLRDRHALVRKYKDDWYDLDFRYLRDHPDFRAYSIYRDAPEFKNIHLDFYPPDAFELRRKHIINFYSEKRENLDREYTWLTPKQADEFVAKAVETIAAELIRFL